jgi:hypothetical protein
VYSVVIKTTNSEIEFGTQISSTKRLHEFLCSMDFQLVTKLEVKYFRELKTPHDLVTMSDASTGALSVVNDSTLISNGPDSWTIETPQAKFQRHLVKR